MSRIPSGPCPGRRGTSIAATALSAILTISAITAATNQFANAAQSANAAPSTQDNRVEPTAAAYPLTPLLTGGILNFKYDVSLLQSVSARTADPDPDGCNERADGTFSVQDVNEAFALVDLGYADMPRSPDEASPEIPVSDTKASGGFRLAGEFWGCSGGEQFLAQGGSCSHTFSPAYEGGLFEPRPNEQYPAYYEPGKSPRVVARANPEPGLNCMLTAGEIPLPPGGYFLDYAPDAFYYGAFIRPSTVAEKDSLVNRFDMARNDSSCVYGEEWWKGQHSTSIYGWTFQNDYSSSDRMASTCSSQRTGFARSEVKRALVVNDVKIFQMDPSGGYVEVPPSEKITDSNTVKIEMLIENRWKSDITAEVVLQDMDKKRKLEAEKDQVNPVQETFVAGAQKKVTFLWRTDGVAWDNSSPVFQRKVGILTPYGGAQFNVQVQPRPALVLHGWNSSAAAWAPWEGFVKGARSDWTVRAVQNMNTDPQRGVSIQQNAATLAAQIATVRADTGAVHVDLVGHSMGGLISRWYLSRMMGSPAGDGRPVVRSLTMFGTPNLGSDCAYEVLGIGTTATAIGSLFGGDGFSSKRFVPTFQLTPFYLAGGFFAQTPAKSGVYYSHRAGIPIPFFACGVPNGQSGLNDGPVVLPSVIGLGRGGRPLALPNLTIHTSMTDDVDYFRSAVDKVLGLGPEKAVALVGSPRSIRTEEDSPKQAPVPGSWSQGASTPFDGDSTLSMTIPAVKARVSVMAPIGAQVTVTGPDGTVLVQASSTGWPVIAESSGKSGQVQITASGAPAGGELAAAMSLPGDGRTVTPTVKRSGNSLVITAKVRGVKATEAQVKALVDLGTARAVTLKKVGKVWTATVKAGVIRDVASVTVVARYPDGEYRVSFAAL